MLRESLARGGARWDGPIELQRSPVAGWRMRASLHFGRGEGGGLRLGLRQEGTRRVVDLEACLQLSEPMNRAARALRLELELLPALAARAHGLDLLEAPRGGALVATLETSLERHEAPALASLGATAGVSGLGVRTRGRALEWLRGSPFVEADVLGVRLRAHAASFFQANRFLLEDLARGVLDLVPAGDSRILDLYAGVGLFALPLAARDRCEIVAVEQSPLAAADARASARRAGLAVGVREASVEQALSALAAREGERVVVDPPRTGFGRGVVDALAARRPAVVVYVSCDPPTLGRDLALFAARGYRPDAVRLYDLFPKTFHMETVVRLRPL